jgi:hypothetical protein
MGFGVPLPPRDETSIAGNDEALSLLPTVSKGFPSQVAGHKQSQQEVEEELNSWLRTESVLQSKKVRLARPRRVISRLVEEENLAEVVIGGE